MRKTVTVYTHTHGERGREEGSFINYSLPPPSSIGTKREEDRGGGLEATNSLSLSGSGSNSPGKSQRQLLST